MNANQMNLKATLKNNLDNSENIILEQLKNQ